MKVEKQSNQLWTVQWIASGFRNNDGLFILAPTPVVACRKAMKFLRESGYIKPEVQGVSHSGTIDVF